MHIKNNRRFNLFVFALALTLLPACGETSKTGPAATTGAGSGSSKSGYEGNFEKATQSALVGWAWDSTRPDTPITIDVFDGPTKVASVVADQFRADLRDAGKGDGKHGFLLPLPKQIQDGKEHTLSIRPAGSDKALGPALTVKPPAAK